jgi:hypothetical protein
MSESLNFGELQAVLQGAFVGYLNRLKPHTVVRELTQQEIVRSNLAHAAVSRALSIRADLEAHLGKIMLKATAGQRIDHPPEPGLAAKLRSSLTRLLKTGRTREYEVMTKEHFNVLIGQKRLWVAGEREAVLDSLCTRDGKLMITRDYFFQHTNKSHAELYVLVHTPTMQIHALAAMADFHTPWTAGQFHHMVHSSQEDRMFFFGRRSEASLMPRVLYDPNSSFEGGTRWSAHFHMPALLAIDIVGVRPGCRGLAIVLMAHISCLQSTFLRERTHLLFDISGREANTRMIRFTQSIGAWRSQTFSDEARSEGFIGVEGDDPSIYWASKQGDAYSSKQEATTSTAGVYAIDSTSSLPIGPVHPAVLFDDRVTQQDFGRGGRNCSYFAIAPVEVAQQRLVDCVDELQQQFASEAREAEAANGTEAKPKPWAASSPR